MLVASGRSSMLLSGWIIYHNSKDQMFQFGEIKQHCIMLQIIHFLYSIQSQFTVQVSVKLSKSMHIIFYSTDLFVSLSLYSIGLITGVTLYQSMHVCWSILI